MNRRATSVPLSLLCALLVAGCADQRNPTEPLSAGAAARSISDASRAGNPIFHWLPPTVAAAPTPTGSFDATALDDLVVEVCVLDEVSSCSGSPVERMTSSGTPVPARLTLNADGEYYSVSWMTGRGHVDPALTYRVRVLRGGVELGFLDVDVVRNTPALGAVDPATHVGVVAGRQLELRFRLDLPSARTHVVVNEVESSAGSPGDWIELFNRADVPLSLAGYVVRDNDDSHSYTLPAGTTIPARGFYVVEEAALGFGLGAADAARLIAPDGTTVVDSRSWSSHAVTTYGRCPDGTGAFGTTTRVTKGATNDCSIIVRINEIESSGGTPGDWVELYNAGPVAASVAGYQFRDSDDSHAYVLPAGTTIPAGGYLVLDEATFGFGLGSADAARLFTPDGALADGHAWTAHAASTHARCPNGVGAFGIATTVTKGAPNACGTPIKVNEVESSGGTPGDWVELHNPSASPVDLSGMIVRDNDDTHSYTIPAGSVIAGAGYFVIDESALGFGLGAADAARLFAPDGATLIDSYAWTAHAATTYGRCPDGSGAFATTGTVTKGAANLCAGQVTALPWPGDPTIATADGLNVFGGNLSGLTYEGSGSATPGVLWAVRNGPGSLFRLLWNGSIWTPDAANGWATGRALRYPDGAGDPDAEGVTFAAGGAAGGVYVSTERNNQANGISRNSILRFDPTSAGPTLTATHEWNLTSDLPANGPNLGLEAITWIPDAALVARGFFDEARGHPYQPAEYPNHGTGLFLVGVEASGAIHAYALDHVDGSFTRVATIASGFPGVMELAFDRELDQLWAVCDDGCAGRQALLTIDTRVGLPTSGRFIVAKVYERPAGMPNLNNEGFTIAPQAECVNGRKPVYWADDSETGGHAIRSGTMSCTAPPG